MSDQTLVEINVDCPHCARMFSVHTKDPHAFTAYAKDTASLLPALRAIRDECEHIYIVSEEWAEAHIRNLTDERLLAIAAKAERDANP